MNASSVKPCDLHGIRQTECAICFKRPNECDYGSCESPATHSVNCHDSTGRRVESRLACDWHAEKVSRY